MKKAGALPTPLVLIDGGQPGGGGQDGVKIQRFQLQTQTESKWRSYILQVLDDRWLDGNWLGLYVVGEVIMSLPGRTCAKPYISTRKTREARRDNEHLFKQLISDRVRIW